MAHQHSLASVALLGLASLALPLTASAATYQFTEFETPIPGPTVNGLSNTGVLVGFDGNLTNFTFAPGGTPTPIPGLSATALANGINSTGEIVGMDGSSAFTLTPGGTETLLPAVQNFTAEAAFGVNDAGIITGQFTAADGSLPGFIDDGGAFETIPIPAGYTSLNVQGINSDGLAVGFYTDAATGIGHGFTYNYAASLGTFNPADFVTLADPVDPYSSTNDFLFSQVLGINGAGIAAGYFGTTAGLQHGFLYDTLTGQYTYLDDPNITPGGSPIMQITGINDAGEIAGFYSDASGLQHGFYANPAAVTAVPEPAPLPLLILGLLPLGLCAARRGTHTSVR